MSEHSTNKEPVQRIGVVTFLDVLGWKGIWQRKTNPIADLEELVNSISDEAEKLSRGTKFSKNDISSPVTEVMIVSDTIVIFTPSGHEGAIQALDLHGSLCKKAIPISVTKGIPLRGATSYGDVVISSDNNIYAGQAIDEAAAWHELGDWIGVLMAPTANFIYEITSGSKWLQYDPPTKLARKFSTHVVDWRSTSDDVFLKEIKQSFCQMAPITPEVEQKFSNTINFLGSKMNCCTSQ